METKSSPLAGQLAGLRAAITSNDDRGWLSASLHAMIAAIFARIFDRLEQILVLWQSGQLPPPQPNAPLQIQRHPAHPDSMCARAPHRQSARTPGLQAHASPPATRRSSQRTRARAASSRTTYRATPAIRRATTTASSARPRRRSCASRAPPPIGRCNSLPAGWHRHAYIITLSL